MREFKRLIEEAKKNITNGFGAIYERSVTNDKEPKQTED
jgi:hypothetical protein